MRTAGSVIRVRTGTAVATENVTGAVRDAVRGTGLRTGIVLVSLPHTTCALCVNEDEAGLRKDIERVAAEILSPLRAARGFEHDRIDHNAQAHLTSLLFGSGLALPLAAGDLVLGTWQSIFLVEMDGPRTREVSVQVLGE